jgi:hypothetical protein
MAAGAMSVAFSSHFFSISMLTRAAFLSRIGCRSFRT